MISLVKIVTEGYAFDADDYIPYANLKPGDIVRCNQNPEDTFKVLEVLGDNKLIVSLVDDPRDIRPVIFDQDVTAHASDQAESNADVEDLDEISDENAPDLADKEREANADPEPEGDDAYDPREIISALPDHAEIVAEGEGFDTVKLEEAINKLLERPYFKKELEGGKDNRGNEYPYVYVSFRMVNRPDKMTAGPALEINHTGKFLLPASSYWSEREKPREERKCDTPATAAPKVQNLLVGMMSPEALKQHVRGWILIDHNIGTHAAEFYPMLDEIGVKMYLKADKDLTTDVNNFYAGSNYWGD